MNTYILKKNGKVVESDHDDTTSFLTVDEMVEDILTNRLSPADKKEIISDEYFPFLHLEFGMWIRNTYGLWHEDCPLTSPNDTSFVIYGIDYNPRHPDAVSSEIIDRVLERLKTGTDDYDHAMQILE